MDRARFTLIVANGARSPRTSFLGNRARYDFIELDMSTGLDKQIDLGKPSSIRVYRSRYINRPRWTNRPRETVLDMSIPSSNCRGRWSKDSHFSGGTSRMLSSSIRLTIALEFSSERHIVVSLSKTESVHIQKNIPFPKKRFAVTTPVF